MGAEAKVVARVDGAEHAGTLQLESTELLFRAPGFRWKIALPKAECEAVGDHLRVRAEGRTVEFRLGAAAATKWLDKIRHPKGLLDKLGVKPESAVAVLDVDDAAFWRELEGRLNIAASSRLKQNLDFVFLGAETPAALQRLEAARGAIREKGAVWVVYPKGVKTITQDDVLKGIRALGLKDVKVAAFSPTHTALKAMK